MRQRQDIYIWALIFLCALSLSPASESSDTNLMSVSRAELCVTEGTIEELPAERLSVSVPKMRAYLNASTRQIVEAPSHTSAQRETKLGSVPANSAASLASSCARKTLAI